MRNIETVEKMLRNKENNVFSDVVSPFTFLQIALPALQQRHSVTAPTKPTFRRVTTNQRKAGRRSTRSVSSNSSDCSVDERR